MVESIEKKEETILEQAQREVKDEKRKKDVKRLKAKLEEVEEANTILKNLQREIEDLEHAIQEGN